MYVISYDISNDRRRNKIAKILLDYGRRVQYSVFECEMNQKTFKELYGKLAKVMAGAEDGNIRFYFLCGKCEKEVQGLGTENDCAWGNEDVFVI